MYWQACVLTPQLVSHPGTVQVWARITERVRGALLELEARSPPNPDQVSQQPACAPCVLPTAGSWRVVLCSSCCAVLAGWPRHMSATMLGR